MTSLLLSLKSIKHPHPAYKPQTQFIVHILRRFDLHWGQRTAPTGRLKRSKVTHLLSLFQYEDLAHYGLEGVGGVYGDPHHHHHHHAAAARSLQAVHLAAAAAAAGPYPPHQYSQSTHTSSGMAATAGDAVKRDKDAIYGYDEFTDTVKNNPKKTELMRIVFFICKNSFAFDLSV